MFNRAKVITALCSAALILAACTVKKAELSPQTEQTPLATQTKEEEPSELAAPVVSSAGTGAPSGRPDRERAGKDILDRLYPSPKKAASPYPAQLVGKGTASTLDKRKTGSQPGVSAAYIMGNMASPSGEADRDREFARCYRCPAPPNTGTGSEEYASLFENGFLDARANPLSTFSIDVDGASYSNTRRFLQEGRLPPAEAVRIEEFINYFDYDYPQPSGSDPFSITTEVADTPWNPDTKLVHIGLQGKRMDAGKLPPTNLVFLIDVSGSMDSPEKLPLLKDAFRMLIDQLRPQDRISIVVYAGAAGMVLPPTAGSDKESIRQALGQLQAGGSTAGGAGLLLAYQAAAQGFIQGGSNRVILATDGDFNVGVSSDAELVRLIEEKRKSGVFLSVLGFGTGNLKDAKMEQLADKGNGNYFYIDNINEARKVLVEKMAGTLFAIAKDVKLQIEFNPATVKSYRLVGYENRMLAAEDFNDDRKDAGELGSGTNVTALYEIVPAAPSRPKVDPLKYQGNQGSRWHWNLGSTKESGQAGATGELLTVKFRYKQPNGSESKLLSRTLRAREGAWRDASENFRFAAAAAGFGLILRGSQYRGDLDFDKVASLARGSKGRDLEGHRAEFIGLVESARSLEGSEQVGYR
ncbi:MAG: VWA domain-containing protein [Fibrobacteria bacterium]